MKYLILTLFLLTMVTPSFSQDDDCNYSHFSDPPKERTIKRVNEYGMRYGNPYTMFVRDNGFSLFQSLAQIRENIVNSMVTDHGVRTLQGYSMLYKGILDAANSGEPNKCVEGDGCGHPSWVKNNAIVFLIGLKYETTSHGQDTFVLMSGGGSVGQTGYYADRAFNGLRNLNPNVETCNGGRCGFMRRKAFDLIEYCEAYDALKAGGKISPFDQDANGGDCTPRNKLRQFAKNFYVEAEDVINSKFGWKKNHGIICCSALGVAALVLNDAGVETSYLNLVMSIVNPLYGIFYGFWQPMPHPKYSPVKWYKRAHGTQGGDSGPFGEDGIEDNFFTGEHTPALGYPNTPETNSDGSAGFAEGPGYFTDMAQAAFIYFRTAGNFLPNTSEKNYLAQKKYQNMLEWYLNILNHDNSCPTYDNTETDWGTLLGVLGMPDKYPGGSEFIQKRVDQGSLMDLRGDYILAMGGGIVDPQRFYANNASGVTGK